MAPHSDCKEAYDDVEDVAAEVEARDIQRDLEQRQRLGAAANEDEEVDDFSIAANPDEENDDFSIDGSFSVAGSDVGDDEQHADMMDAEDYAVEQGLHFIDE